MRPAADDSPLWLTTADCFRSHLLADVLGRSRWTLEETESVSIFVAALCLMWTSNPWLLSDSTYLSGGVHVGLMSLLFEPMVARYSVEDTWTLTVESQQQADVLFELCSCAVLLCHIHEVPIAPTADDEGRSADDTFIRLLYGDAAPWLIPQRSGEVSGAPLTRCEVASHLEFKRRMEHVNYAPLNELHRHQQQSLTSLFHNHFGTARFGLSMDDWNVLSYVQKRIKAEFEEQVLPCINFHLDKSVRPDLRRLLQLFTQ